MSSSRTLIIELCTPLSNVERGNSREFGDNEGDENMKENLAKGIDTFQWIKLEQVTTSIGGSCYIMELDQSKLQAMTMKFWCR